MCVQVRVKACGVRDGVKGSCKLSSMSAKNCTLVLCEKNVPSITVLSPQLPLPDPCSSLSVQMVLGRGLQLCLISIYESKEISHR